MTVQLPISASPQPVRFSAREFWLLADAGVFQEFVKTELIEGEISVVNSVHSRHARTQAVLNGELYAALKNFDLVLLATPSTELSNDSIPEPDLAIAIKADGRAVAGADVLLAIEISDTTLKEDMGSKMRLYARNAIPEYWVADVDGEVIHQYSDPGPNGYSDHREIKFGDDVASVVINGLTLATSALLYS